MVYGVVETACNIRGDIGVATDVISRFPNGKIFLIIKKKSPCQDPSSIRFLRVFLAYDDYTRFGMKIIQRIHFDEKEEGVFNPRSSFQAIFEISLD